MRVAALLITMLTLLIGSLPVVFADATVSKKKTLTLSEPGFVYRIDAEVRFLDGQRRWGKDHDKPMDAAALGEIAKTAYEASSMEQPLERWLYHGGPNPEVFRACTKITNPGETPWLDVPVTLTLQAGVGTLNVDPALYITDFAHLKDTITWEAVSTVTRNIPAVAGGETVTVYSEPFELYPFLQAHPEQWPAKLSITVSAPGVAPQATKLELVPDHFVVPSAY